MQVALEAAQAEAAPLREESRVLREMARVMGHDTYPAYPISVDARHVDLREAKAAAEAKEAEATKAEAAVLAPTRRRLAAALHTHATVDQRKAP